jgi:ABC-2 type transport system ATP-binding protein
MSSALQIENVDQFFRTGFWMKRMQVLHQISFSVPVGSVFGFLGANGAGKTTLIHMIVGLGRPSNGSVKVFSKDAMSISAKAKIGYLPERPYFHPHLTGDGLLRYFGELSGMSRSMIASRIPSVLSAVGMADARKTQLKKYSKGMLQRIGIAQAMIHDPELLVLDEPMSGLDPIGRKEIRELIVRLAAEGRTVFFSSHVIPDVEAICNQVGVIQKGKLVGCGPIGDFLADGSRQIEIAFSGLTAKYDEWPEFKSLRKIQSGMIGIAHDQEAVDKALRKLLKQKSRILWVSPMRSSLEDFFEEKK